MNRIKIIMALFAIIAFSSCQQQYNCHCEFGPNYPYMPTTNNYEIKACSHSEAVDKCNDMETCDNCMGDQIDVACTLQ